jgi:nucleotide-binding universal stress UspA family protein
MGGSHVRAIIAAGVSCSAATCYYIALTVEGGCWSASATYSIGSAVGRVTLGQQAERGNTIMYKNILIAVDGSELSNKALTQGIELAKAIGAKVTVLNVTPRWSTVAAGGDVAVMFPPEAYEENIAEAAELLLSKSAATAESAGLSCDTVRASDAHPYKAILETASAKSCDLIVMGSHGRRGAAGLLLGSETQKTLTHGKIPVLVYRE